MDMYDGDYEYANSRLQGTAVRYGDRLFQIDEVNHHNKAEGAFLDNGDYTRISLDKLDLQPLPLGYVNLHQTASYVTRIPRRDDWRQGTRRRVLCALDGLDTQHIGVEKLEDCVNNIYPTFKRCLAIVRDNQRAAWCRIFCVDKFGDIYHKGKKNKVGEVVEDKPVLLDGYVYLQEVLDESLEVV